MGEITWLDYVLLPFYLYLIYRLAFYCRKKYYPENHAYRPYFIPALTAKIAGAIFIGLVYNYYYGGGDTFNFFYHSQLINSTLTTDAGAWFRLITHHADPSNLVDGQTISNMYWYDDAPAYTTSCLGALIGIFCFTQYLPLNIVIASISFIGMWLMFVTFARQYPTLIKPVAIAVLFIPGPVVWGSGLFKDTFCMFSIGCLIYSTYILIEQRTFKFSLVLISLLSVALLALIKAYILVALLPVLILKVILVYKKKAAADPKKRMPFYLILGLLSFLGIFLIRRVVVYLSVFTVENVLETIKHQKDYLLQVSIEQEGSAYDLGDFDPTLGSLFSKFWPAVNVTLFRPYLWESRSIIQLFDAFQSAGILLLTLYLVVRKNLWKTLKSIYYDPNLIMCLLFTLLFAFLVGVSTYNFGSLSRYKIPCIPFYVLFLLLLIFKNDAPDAPPNVNAETDKKAGHLSVE